MGSKHHAPEKQREFLKVALDTSVRTACDKFKVAWRTGFEWFQRHARGQLHPDLSRPVVEGGFVECEDREEEWKRAVTSNKKVLKKVKEQHNVTIDKSGECLPIAITFVSDQHISVHAPVEMEMMESDAKLIRDTPGMFCVLAGDAIDNHIKHHSAMINARTNPREQYRLFDTYLGWLESKVLAMISGNHDDWTGAFAGVDVLESIAKSRRVHFTPDEIRIALKLPGYTYQIAARHQYRFNSTLNNTHSMKQWYRFGPAPFDIGCLAHLHELALEPVFMHDLQRWVCRPGSYQYNSKYSQQYGFNGNAPGCPTFVIYPDHREIVGFTDLRQGQRFLAGERERYLAKMDEKPVRRKR